MDNNRTGKHAIFSMPIRYSCTKIRFLIGSPHLHISAKLLNVAQRLQHGVHEASVAQISQSRSSIGLGDRLVVIIVVIIVVVVIEAAIDGLEGSIGVPRLIGGFGVGRWR